MNKAKVLIDKVTYSITYSFDKNISENTFYIYIKSSSPIIKDIPTRLRIEKVIENHLHQPIV